MQRADLLALLQHPNLHQIAGRAQALRQDRFGRETSFAAIDHLDLGSGRRWCAVCGGESDAFCGAPADLADAATEIHLLFPDDASVSDRRAAPAAVPAGTPAVSRTIIPGTMSELLAAGIDDGGWNSLADIPGVVLSDGVHPRVHPAVGSGDAWARAWTEASRAGLTGHASVLYGPHHGIEAVLDQIDALARLQAEAHPFWSVAPLIFHPESFGGVQDNLLTHGGHDLRVLAAVRLGLPDVPHVRVEYNRSDLKLAHISLSSGADDVAGHLFLGTRSSTENANAKDLSLAEMPGWLQEVGFTPIIRNARYQTAPARHAAASS